MAKRYESTNANIIRKVILKEKLTLNNMKLIVKSNKTLPIQPVTGLTF